METAPLRVAVVGAGPAGIYAAVTLIKSVAGVAPDHPRITFSSPGRAVRGGAAG